MPSLTPAQWSEVAKLYKEGAELGVDWQDAWERAKKYVRDRRPTPGKPGQPLPQLPKIPGPPSWLFWAFVAYLLWRWD